MLMLKTEEWMSVAKDIWNACKEARAEHPEMDEGHIIGALKKQAIDSNGDLHRSMLFTALVTSADGQITAVNMYRWADSGFPTVEIGHKFAASMLVSTVSDEVLQSIKIPWPGFSIMVPEGLLLVFDPATDKYIPIKRVFVSVSKHARHNKIETTDKHVGNWQFIGMSSGTIALWRFGVSPQGLMVASNDLVGPDGVDVKVKLLQLDLKHTDVDSRTAGLIGRLIVTTCVALTMKELVTERTRPKTKKNKKRDTKAGPEARYYVIGKPISLDFRERVRQYMMGESRKSKELSIQHMVAGHFKNQPHGKENKERKTIWVTPYWRGPDEGAIPIKIHSKA